MFDKLQSKIEEDNKSGNVQGVSSMHYFVRENDGQIHLYERVHTVLGDMFEISPEWEQVEQSSAKQIERLLEEEKYLYTFADNVKLFLKSTYPEPTTHEFMVMAKYNLMIENMVEEYVRHEITKIV